MNTESSLNAGQREAIERLRLAVERTYHSRASHVCTTVVHETFRGCTLWWGHVEIFRLEKHPTARRCFGWFVEDRPVTVLEVNRVDSPQAAVRAYMAPAARLAAD